MSSRNCSTPADRREAESRLIKKAKRLNCPECQQIHFPNCIGQRLRVKNFDPSTPTANLPKFINNVAIEDDDFSENNKNPRVVGTDPTLKCPDQGEEPPEFAVYQIKEPSLTRKQKHQLLKVLKSSKRVFAADDMDLGTWSEGTHHIETGDYPPIACVPHQMPHHLRPGLRVELDAMQARGFLEPSNSPWAAPIVYVRKNDGNWRLCVDFRKLNQIAQPCVYPLPRIQDIFASLEGSRFFTSLDLAKGFWQIKLDEGSKQKPPSLRFLGCLNFEDSQWAFRPCREHFKLVCHPFSRG